MSGFSIEFSPWGQFHARKKREEIHRWLWGIGFAGSEAFRSGMGHYPPSSAPGAWPNNRTGRLNKSIHFEATGDSVTIGTSMPYSGFLRSGTSKMARRKMSDNALEEGMKGSRLGKWVGWSRGGLGE
jgi:hypothetical protein